MAPIIDPALRGVLFLFSAVALGLTAGWVADENSSSRVRFAVFSASFSLLFGVFYGLLAAFIEFLAFPLVLAVIDFLNWVFLFSGATAIAAKIGAGSCSNKENLAKHFPTHSEKDCRLAQAGTAFLYFSWAIAVVLFVYSVLGVVRSGSIGAPRRSAPRGVPTMSQV